ncbi:MAG TPA: 5-formyltetrahydrofolate cyclo-ligase [Methylomirabilota bacterium]|nr:5-formyltetrahydrofolate cyclo-ligase [Methylomirabilota bacterium]
MGLEPREKREIREHVWSRLRCSGVARFPGAKGRIPNFVGAERAAKTLGSLPIWKRARVLKVNPDAPQLPVRRLALREGKTVYMAVPRLRSLECFIELDPVRLGEDLAKSASIVGAWRYGRLVQIHEVQPIDLVIIGAVAVNTRGARVGKGGGYADLEYALLREAGKVSARTPVVTTVHALQVVPHDLEMCEHDIALDWIVEPDAALRCGQEYPKPNGIHWEILSAEKIETIPVLAALHHSILL